MYVIYVIQNDTHKFMHNYFQYESNNINFVVLQKSCIGKEIVGQRLV
jgi:hypothetical protein